VANRLTMQIRRKSKSMTTSDGFNHSRFLSANRRRSLQKKWEQNNYEIDIIPQGHFISGISHASSEIKKDASFSPDETIQDEKEQFIVFLNFRANRLVRGWWPSSNAQLDMDQIDHSYFRPLDWLLFIFAVEFKQLSRENPISHEMILYFQVDFR